MIAVRHYRRLCACLSVNFSHLLLRLLKRALVDAFCRGWISARTVQKAFKRFPLKHL